ncbi:hypothetical protein DIPPA_22183 [Diplonema papillatum]|nr:hypothetical protein DIPPA_22183 [Diplonema papillatum]
MNGEAQVLEVTVVKASGLANLADKAKCALYVAVQGSGRTVPGFAIDTRAIPSPNPVWDKRFLLRLPGKVDKPTTISFEVHDKIGKNGFLGYAESSFNREQLEKMAIRDTRCVLQLSGRPGKSKDKKLSTAAGGSLGVLEVVFRPTMAAYTVPGEAADPASFSVTFIGGEDLRGSPGSPYCKVMVVNATPAVQGELTTTVAAASKNPRWEQKFLFFPIPPKRRVADKRLVLAATVWDAATKPHTFLGHCEVPLSAAALEASVGTAKKMKVHMAGKPGDKEKGFGALLVEIRASADGPAQLLEKDALTDEVDVTEERRQDTDGRWYTQNDFIDYYGGVKEWETAPKMTPAQVKALREQYGSQAKRSPKKKKSAAKPARKKPGGKKPRAKKGAPKKSPGGKSDAEEEEKPAAASDDQDGKDKEGATGGVSGDDQGGAVSGRAGGTEDTGPGEAGETRPAAVSEQGSSVGGAQPAPGGKRSAASSRSSSSSSSSSSRSKPKPGANAISPDAKKSTSSEHAQKDKTSTKAASNTSGHPKRKDSSSEASSSSSSSTDKPTPKVQDAKAVPPSTPAEEPIEDPTRHKSGGLLKRGSSSSSAPPSEPPQESNKSNVQEAKTTSPSTSVVETKAPTHHKSGEHRKRKSSASSSSSSAPPASEKPQGSEAAREAKKSAPSVSAKGGAKDHADRKGSASSSSSSAPPASEKPRVSETAQEAKKSAPPVLAGGESGEKGGAAKDHQHRKGSAASSSSSPPSEKPKKPSKPESRSGGKGKQSEDPSGELLAVQSSTPSIPGVQKGNDEPLAKTLSRATSSRTSARGDDPGKQSTPGVDAAPDVGGAKHRSKGSAAGKTLNAPEDGGDRDEAADPDAESRRVDSSASSEDGEEKKSGAKGESRGKTVDPATKNSSASSGDGNGKKSDTKGDSRGKTGDDKSKAHVEHDAKSSRRHKSEFDEETDAKSSRGRKGEDDAQSDARSSRRRRSDSRADTAAKSSRGRGSEDGAGTDAEGDRQRPADAASTRDGGAGDQHDDEPGEARRKRASQASKPRRQSNASAASGALSLKDTDGGKSEHKTEDARRKPASQASPDSKPRRQSNASAASGVLPLKDSDGGKSEHKAEDARRKPASQASQASKPRRQSNASAASGALSLKHADGGKSEHEAGGGPPRLEDSAAAPSRHASKPRPPRSLASAGGGALRPEAGETGRGDPRAQAPGDDAGGTSNNKYNANDFFSDSSMSMASGHRRLLAGDPRSEGTPSNASSHAAKARHAKPSEGPSKQTSYSTYFPPKSGDAPSGGGPSPNPKLPSSASRPGEATGDPSEKQTSYSTYFPPKGTDAPFSGGGAIPNPRYLSAVSRPGEAMGDPSEKQTSYSTYFPPKGSDAPSGGGANPNPRYLSAVSRPGEAMGEPSDMQTSYSMYFPPKSSGAPSGGGANPNPRYLSAVSRPGGAPGDLSEQQTSYSTYHPPAEGSAARAAGGGDASPASFSSNDYHSYSFPQQSGGGAAQPGVASVGGGHGGSGGQPGFDESTAEHRLHGETSHASLGMEARSDASSKAGKTKSSTIPQTHNSSASGAFGSAEFNQSPTARFDPRQLLGYGIAPKRRNSEATGRHPAKQHGRGPPRSTGLPQTAAGLLASPVAKPRRSSLRQAPGGNPLPPRALAAEFSPEGGPAGPPLYPSSDEGSVGGALHQDPSIAMDTRTDRSSHSGMGHPWEATVPLGQSAQLAGLLQSNRASSPPQFTSSSVPPRTSSLETRVANAPSSAAASQRNNLSLGPASSHGVASSRGGPTRGSGANAATDNRSATQRPSERPLDGAWHHGDLRVENGFNPHMQREESRERSDPQEVCSAGLWGGGRQPGAAPYPLAHPDGSIPAARGLLPAAPPLRDLPPAHAPVFSHQECLSPPRQVTVVHVAAAPPQPAAPPPPQQYQQYTARHPGRAAASPQWPAGETGQFYPPPPVLLHAQHHHSPLHYRQEESAGYLPAWGNEPGYYHEYDRAAIDEHPQARGDGGREKAAIRLAVQTGIQWLVGAVAPMLQKAAAADGKGGAARTTRDRKAKRAAAKARRARKSSPRAKRGHSPARRRPAARRADASAASRRGEAPGEAAALPPHAFAEFAHAATSAPGPPSARSAPGVGLRSAGVQAAPPGGVQPGPRRGSGALSVHASGRAAAARSASARPVASGAAGGEGAAPLQVVDPPAAARDPGPSPAEHAAAWPSGASSWAADAGEHRYFSPRARAGSGASARASGRSASGKADYHSTQFDARNSRAAAGSVARRSGSHGVPGVEAECRGGASTQSGCWTGPHGAPRSASAHGSSRPAAPSASGVEADYRSTQFDSHAGAKPASAHGSSRPGPSASVVEAGHHSTQIDGRNSRAAVKPASAHGSSRPGAPSASGAEADYSHAAAKSASAHGSSRPGAPSASVVEADYHSTPFDDRNSRAAARSASAHGSSRRAEADARSTQFDAGVSASARGSAPGASGAASDYPFDDRNGGPGASAAAARSAPEADARSTQFDGRSALSACGSSRPGVEHRSQGAAAPGNRPVSATGSRIGGMDGDGGGGTRPGKKGRPSFSFSLRRSGSGPSSASSLSASLWSRPGDPFAQAASFFSGGRRREKESWSRPAVAPAPRPEASAAGPGDRPPDAARGVLQKMGDMFETLITRMNQESKAREDRLVDEFRRGLKKKDRPKKKQRDPDQENPGKKKVTGEGEHLLQTIDPLAARPEHEQRRAESGDDLAGVMHRLRDDTRRMVDVQTRLDRLAARVAFDVKREEDPLVKLWLARLDLQELRPAFSARGLTMRDIPFLTDADLLEMDINSKASRLQILTEAALLAADNGA